MHVGVLQAASRRLHYLLRLDPMLTQHWYLVRMQALLVEVAPTACGFQFVPQAVSVVCYVLAVNHVTRSTRPNVVPRDQGCQHQHTLHTNELKIGLWLCVRRSRDNF